MQEINDVDLGFSGRKFTWENTQQNSLIKERLDRAIASVNWIHSNPQASVEHLPLEESDHCPTLIRTQGVREITKRPFRFLQA